MRAAMGGTGKGRGQGTGRWAAASRGGLGAESGDNLGRIANCRALCVLRAEPPQKQLLRRRRDRRAQSTCTCGD
eukprot:6992584-Prymnesium_polylepis.1